MNGWYLVITQDMVEGLGLRGSELLVYALVNGYSQGGRGMFTGSLEHVAAVCGISRRTAARVLASLVDTGRLEKVQYEVNGVRYTSYKVAGAAGDAAPEPVDTPCAGMSTAEDKVSRGSAKMAPNNKRKENKEKSISSSDEDKIDTKKGRVSVRSKFEEGLIELGITPETAEAWIRVRRAKRAVNSEIALKGIAREIGKTGRSAEECAQLAVEQSWQGFNAVWAERFWNPQRHAAPQQSAPRLEDYERVKQEVIRRVHERAAKERELEERQKAEEDAGRNREYPVFKDLLSH